jgi:hypothetical protein
LSTYQPIFDECFVKIRRAQEHAGAVLALAQHIHNDRDNWPTVSYRFDTETNEHVLYIATMPRDFRPELQRIRVLTGDAIHNLRGALDYLVHQLALWHKDGMLKKPRATGFPITNSEQAWDQSSGHHLSEVHPNHRSVIKRLQPMGRPGHALELLRILSDTDKHRLLNLAVIAADVIANPAVSIAGAVFVANAFKVVATPEADFDFKGVERGVEIVRSRWPELPVRHPDVEIAGLISPQVSFEHGFVATDTLIGIGRAVWITVAKFLPLSRA